MKHILLFLLVISFFALNAQRAEYKTNGLYHGLWKSMYYFDNRQEQVVVYNYDMDAYKRITEVYLIDRYGDTAYVSASVLGDVFENWSGINYSLSMYNDGRFAKDTALKIARLLHKLDSMQKSEQHKNDSIGQANEILKIKQNKNAVILFEARPVDESEYTDGTGFRVNFFNQSKKSIKYITFNLNAYNAVNDLIGSKAVKGVGPIEHLETAEYKWDYIWFTDLVERVTISKITIQYMDGLITTIIAPKITPLEYLTIEELKILKK